MLLDTSRLRRREDLAAGQMAALSLPAAGYVTAGTKTEVQRADRSASQPSADSRDTTMLMLGSGDARDLFVPAFVRPQQPDIAVSEARQSLMRAWRRSNLPEKLLDFFSALGDAQSAEAVCEVVSRAALQMVGGYDASVLLLSGDPELSSGLLAGGSRFGRPGIMMGTELRFSVGSAPGGMELSDQVSHVAHVPMGSEGILFVADRRSERIFESDDWEILSALADQGARAFERVRKLAQAEEQSLYDALTGLANRRLMEIALQQGWAGAQRGEGLALIMIDLDNFKEINDTFGHRMGDEVLKVVGETLRGEARGVDVVARYGGDEFIIIMPRGSASGARALTKRLRSRLAGWVEFTAGVACYTPNQLSSGELIELADKALYAERLKQGRGRIDGAEGARALNSA